MHRHLRSTGLSELASDTLSETLPKVPKVSKVFKDLKDLRDLTPSFKKRYMVFNFEVDATSKLNTILNKLLRLLECLTHFNIIYKPSVHFIMRPLVISTTDGDLCIFINLLVS